MSVNASSAGIFVLDSFALLAYLNGETGAKRVAELLNEAQDSLER